MKHKVVLLALALVLAFGAFSASAHDENNSISVGGFSLSFNHALAENISATRYAGDDPSLPPGATEAPHMAITLYNEAPNFDIIPAALDSVAQVRVYDVADFADYPAIQSVADQLRMILDERPDLATYGGPIGEPDPAGTSLSLLLPYLPIYPAGQVIRAQQQYVETDEVVGISYITYYAEAVEPFLPDHFIYTFQGFSADGEKYISVVAQVETALFPAELPADFDLAVFSEQQEAYFAESTETINAAASGDFSPVLDELEALVQTFAFAE
jgi:hypothetical protein